MIDRSYLKQICADEGISLNDIELDLLDRYAEMLVAWNEKINLTAITQPKEIAVKHFLDSLLLLKSISVQKGATIMDVGTGAGFPSVPCKILRNDIQLTLLDSLNKRIVFLKELTAALKMDVQCIHARAEDAGQDSDYRENFDIVTARAVAHLRELSEYCLPIVKVGGFFVALKGFEIEDELAEAAPAIKTMGGQVIKVIKYKLPDDSHRSFVVIKKISQTPTKYPRSTAKMKKQPLK